MNKDVASKHETCVKRYSGRMNSIVECKNLTEFVMRFGIRVGGRTLSVLKKDFNYWLSVCSVSCQYPYERSKLAYTLDPEMECNS